MWKEQAEALFFVEHFKITDIAIIVKKSRKTVSNYLNSLESYEYEMQWRRAARFFLLIEQSYGSGLDTYKHTKKDINSVIENLKTIQQRLSTVIIENKDFEDLIKIYDNKNTFFYLDPPYYNAEKYYKPKFLKDDHIRLYKIIRNIRGKFLLSYNNCEYIVIQLEI